MILTKEMVDNAYNEFAHQVALIKIEEQYESYKEGFKDGYKIGFFKLLWGLIK